MTNLICALFAVTYIGGETAHIPTKYQEKTVFTINKGVITEHIENTSIVYKKSEVIKMGKHIHIHKPTLTRKYYCKEIL